MKIEKLKHYCIVVLLAFITTISSTTLAQNVGINATGANPDQSAMLDVSSANKGMLVPRVADTNIVNNAAISGSYTLANGLIIYDLSTQCLRTHNGSYWSGCLSSIDTSALISTIVDSVGGWHGSKRIKILPSDAAAGLNTNNYWIGAQGAYLELISGSSVTVYISVVIPEGYKATEAVLYTNNVGPAYVTVNNINTAVPVTTYGGATASNSPITFPVPIPSTSTNYLTIQLNLSTSTTCTRFYGGYITIQPI